jgi:hypothetical protein
LNELIHKNKGAISSIQVLVSLSQGIRELEIERTLFGHLKADHVKSHISVLTRVFKSFSRNLIPIGVIISNGKLAHSPGVLSEGEVKCANKLIVDTERNVGSVNSISAVACISSHLGKKPLKYL